MKPINNTALATPPVSRARADLAVKALCALDLTAAEARTLVARASARVGADSSFDQLLLAALQEIPAPASR